MQNLLKHVLVIPDGNGRWATQRSLPRYEGHIKGVERFREISKVAREMGISFAFWAASGANLRGRNHIEVLNLVLLLQQELERQDTLSCLLENRIRFRVLGDWHKILYPSHFPRLGHLLHLIHFLQEQTRKFDQNHLTILFGYSGEDELMWAVREDRKRRPKHFDERTFKRGFWTSGLPLVDLIIRTGAERPNQTHTSDGIFNPWFTPESQIFISTTLWPDFTEKEFREFVVDYSKTPRRLGA